MNDRILSTIITASFSAFIALVFFVVLSSKIEFPQKAESIESNTVQPAAPKQDPDNLFPEGFTYQE